MAITIDWGTKVISIPQSFLTFVGGTSYTLDTNALRIALKDLEDSEEGVAFPQTHNHNTSVNLGGIEYARIIEIINGYTITFEDGIYSVSLIGSNNNILDVANLNQVSVRANNSAGLINVSEVQVAAFEGGVTVDVGNTSGKAVSGTIYPIGTKAVPSNNLTDARTIAAGRGFDTFYVLGNLTIGATDDVNNKHFYGQGATFNVKKTTITLTSGCITTNAHWHNCMIQGVQGGESNYHDCLIGVLTNAHCHYEECKMVGPVQFSTGIGSTHTTDLIDCYTSNNEYVVDCNGSQLKQVYNNFVGKIKFTNATHSGSIISINITSGEITIDSSCTAGTINIRGNALLINNSGGTRVKTEGLITENFHRIRHVIESLRPHHTGNGTVYYWDPTNGLDTNDGLSSSSACKTFAYIHDNLVVDWNHDTIICYHGDLAGVTTTSENVTISKNYVFLRGPGRAFLIDAVNDTVPAVHILGKGCEVSKVRVSTSPTSNRPAIESDGDFALIENVWVHDAVDGILVMGGEYTILKDVKCHHNSGYGVKVINDSTHIDIVNCHIGSNLGNGIWIDSAAGHEVNIMGETVIHNNGGWGIRVEAGSSTAVIHSDVSTFSNTLGDLSDAGSNTFIQERSSATLISNTVWDELASEHNTALTMGSKLNAAGTAGDPWGADLSTYGPGTAGYMVVDTNTVVNQIEGLTPTQGTMLLEMYELLGLDPLKPLTVTNTSRTVTGINQTITSNANSTVVQRV